MADSPPPAVTFSEAYAQHPDKGGAFAQFVGEMFADAGDGLSNFLAPGKDGAIDLYDATSAGVWECKFVGSDGIDDARARWAEVATHLRDNLLPGAPKPGQAQYAPWYNAGQPIAHYRFCTSARLANLAQCQALEREISAHFAMLAQRAGLEHLAGIDVEVWTWDRIEPALSRRPQLRLRWFNTGWPIGVRELSRVLQHPHSGFAAYLYGSSRLTYVGLGDALSAPALLGDLAESARCSTVLHGRGGAGKSRLMLEVGHAALAAGWVVLQVQAHTTPVDELAGVVRAAGQAQVLLLMDYVERCVTWDEWIAQLQALADAGAKVKLLGTCRSSWVDRLDSYQTDLVPLPEALPAAVHGILAQRPGLADMASVCRDVPVFAAFLCLLHDTGKVQALESLRQQQDFNRWLQAHIARWPGTAALVLPGHREALVELLLNLPCADAALRQLEIEQPAAKAYREQPHQDGWLACELDAPASEQWATLHDGPGRRCIAALVGVAWRGPGRAADAALAAISARAGHAAGVAAQFATACRRARGSGAELAGDLWRRRRAIVGAVAQRDPHDPAAAGAGRVGMDGATSVRH